MGGERSQKNFIQRPKLDLNSNKYDRQSLVQLHEFGESVLSEYEMVIAPIDNYLKQHEFAISSIPLSGLTPISFDQLKVEHFHKERKLVGKLGANPFSTVNGILTVLEDNNRAVRLAIWNADPNSRTTLQDAQKLYPKGATVAVKEPFLTMIGDNIGQYGHAITVCLHPSNIFKLNLFREQVENIWNEGNKNFRDNDKCKARKNYSKCIETASAQLKDTDSSKDNYPKIKRYLVKAYYNRAQICLNSMEFESALEDSKEALQIDPCNCKALYQKGLALLGLGRLEAAADCFKETEKASPGFGDTVEALQGKYDIDDQP